MKKGFTIMELLVAIGLLAAVLAASSMIFSYSIDAQRKAGATAEIMRTLRAITDQLNINLGGLKKDGYLILWSKEVNPPGDTDRLDALYFFSQFLANHFQSWNNPAVWSDTARIFLGHSRTTYNAGQLPGDLALDFLLLTPGLPPPPVPSDCCATSFAQCQPDMTGMGNPITGLGGEVPQNVLSTARPVITPTNVRSLLSQNVGSFKVEWTYGWFRPPVLDKIVWWGFGNPLSVETNLQMPDGTLLSAADIGPIATAIKESTGPPYTVEWNKDNQTYWPKALKFTFTLYDSKGIIKNGRRFEHIVYIGK
jgi:prepilin-type N-terminal cleavage/methylation domain-containing protein